MRPRDQVCPRSIPLPRVLSILAKHDPNATVAGLDTVPAEDRPPVNVVRIAFQTMVGIGTLLAALALLLLWTWWRHRRLPRSPWFYRALVLAGPLAVVALIAGWVTTEVGPPAVDRLPRDAAPRTPSPAPAGFRSATRRSSLVYIGLAVAVVLGAARGSPRAPLPEGTDA